MSAVYHPDLIQGSEEWYAARRGLLTASEMKLIITPTLKIASNDKEKQHLFELMAQRVTGYTEAQFVGFDMIRGQEEEILARYTYSERYAPIDVVGFVTNNKWGLTIGYSPDGLVGYDGLIECKSRRAKYQMQTIIEQTVPDEYVIQVQTGLLVSERKWCDFVSYCGGLPMVTIRVYPDAKVQAAIIEAAEQFEGRLLVRLAEYESLLKSKDARLIPTERTVQQEMYV